MYILCIFVKKILIYLKVLFICVLGCILYQDFRYRRVTLLFFIIAIVLGFFLYLERTSFQFLLINVTINSVFLFFIFCFLLLYSNLVLKKRLKYSIGFGDFLFFFLLAVSFSTIVFLVLFSVSLIFSLFLFLVLKKNLKNKTVPLAGFQSLFLILVLILNELFSICNLYI